MGSRLRTGVAIGMLVVIVYLVGLVIDIQRSEDTVTSTALPSAEVTKPPGANIVPTGTKAISAVEVVYDPTKAPPPPLFENIALRRGMKAMKTQRFALVALFVVIVFSLPIGQIEVAAQTSSSFIGRVSVASNGAQGNASSSSSFISDDGRYVVFTSDATNLVADDNNNASDVFVHDRQTGQTTRVSVSSSGLQANNVSAYPSISSDGRYVAFMSFASNLVIPDENGNSDIFVRDRQIGQTRRVSVSSSGIQANGGAYNPVISANGQFVIFYSSASNLVPDDTNNTVDVFVHDLQTGQTTCASVNAYGVTGNAQSGAGMMSISTDGRYAAFGSFASNLVSDDTNGTWDVFLRDRQTNQTTRVSVASDGIQANGSSSVQQSSISSDGRYVVFTSDATNLVAGDTNGVWDIFAHDRQTGQTTRVSVASDSSEANGSSLISAISADGRYVAFSSEATNLVADDTNGVEDVFVHDRQTDQTTRVSLATDGSEANNDSQPGASGISGDGRFASFSSPASNLVPGDTNDCADVFVVSLLFGVPFPPSPSNAAPSRSYFATSTPTLTWNRANGATEYEIQVDNAAAFTTPLSFATTVPATILEVTTTPLPDGLYYWRVRAKNGSTTGAWSAVDSFIVDVP